MNTAMRQKKALFIIFTVLISVTFACNINQHENVQDIKLEFYIINPQTILQSITQKEKGIFPFPLSEPPIEIPSTQQNVVNWKINEYIKINEAIYDQIWDDTLNGWHLTSISFSLGCKDAEKGFQDGWFIYFKDETTPSSIIRKVREINIDPRNNYIMVYERKYEPKLIDWSVIDVKKLKVSADDALQIAEKDGGWESRINAKNNCYIDLWLVPGKPGYKGWNVGYSSPNATYSDIFKIKINPYTGEKEK